MRLEAGKEYYRIQIFSRLVEKTERITEVPIDEILEMILPYCVPTRISCKKQKAWVLDRSEINHTLMAGHFIPIKDDEYKKYIVEDHMDWDVKKIGHGAGKRVRKVLEARQKKIEELLREQLTETKAQPEQLQNIAVDLFSHLPEVAEPEKPIRNILTEEQENILKNWPQIKTSDNERLITLHENVINLARLIMEISKPCQLLNQALNHLSSAQLKAAATITYD
jgi:hypothetical protein